MTPFIYFINDKITEKNRQFNFKPESVLIPIHNKNNTIRVDDQEVSFFNIIANKAIAEVNLFHSTITPIYKTYIDIVNKKISDSKTTSKLEAYRIVEVQNLFLEELVNENKGKFAPNDPIVGYEGLAGYIGKPESQDEIEEYFKYENNTLDSYLDDIRNKFSDYDYEKFWDKYVAQLGDISLFNNLTIDLLSSYEDITLLYVISKNLMKEKPVWCTLSEDTYFGLVSKFYRNMTTIVGKFISYKKSVFNNDRLIYKVDNVSNYVYVDKTLYDKFLEEDGTPDTILGLVISKDYELNRDTFKLSYLKSKQFNYTELYKNAMALDKMSILTDQASSYKAIYILMIEQLFKDNLPKDIIEEYKLDKNKVIKEATAILNNESIKNLLNVDKIALKIIGLTIFKDTNYYDFTHKMISYNKILLREDPNKDISANELAVYAITEYVADYILNQCEITKL